MLYNSHLDKCSIMLNSITTYSVIVNKHLLGDRLNNNLEKYISWAGGPSVVSRELGLSRTTIWTWKKIGFPDSDFSGRTSYAKQLAKLCRDNGYIISKDKVLRAGKP